MSKVPISSLNSLTQIINPLGEGGNLMEEIPVYNEKTGEFVLFKVKANKNGGICQITPSVNNFDFYGCQLKSEITLSHLQTALYNYVNKED